MSFYILNGSRYKLWPSLQQKLLLESFRNVKKEGSCIPAVYLSCCLFFTPLHNFFSLLPIITRSSSVLEASELFTLNKLCEKRKR